MAVLLALALASLVTAAGLAAGMLTTRPALALARRAAPVTTVRRMGASAPVEATSTPNPTPTPTPVPAAPSVTTTYALDVGGLRRTYEVIAPAAPLAAALPAVVFLHGIQADLDSEVQRDDLLPEVDAGEAILVYPAGYERSWNVGPCCGAAQQSSVDDVAFVSAVLGQVAAMPGVDPARVFLAGYSNGGKLAYLLACQPPVAIAAVAVINAVAVTDCPAGPPEPLLLVAGTADSEIPYPAGAAPVANLGVLNRSSTDQVDQWAQRDGCADTTVTQTAGALTTQLWTTCDQGTVVELATFQGGTHDMPAGDAVTPSAGQAVWSFLSFVAAERSATAGAVAAAG